MFPDKEARQTCWAHKDSYWACLDEGKTLEQCAELRKQYEKFCPNQWVKHFDRKREYLLFKQDINSGFQPSFPTKNEQK